MLHINNAHKQVYKNRIHANYPEIKSPTTQFPVIDDLIEQGH